MSKTSNKQKIETLQGWIASVNSPYKRKPKKTISK
jgi:hypothetical protein